MVRNSCSGVAKDGWAVIADSAAMMNDESD
jgi:hypothetical protein